MAWENRVPDTVGTPKTEPRPESGRAGVVPYGDIETNGASSTDPSMLPARHLPRSFPRHLIPATGLRIAWRLMLAACVLFVACEPGAWEDPAAARTATVCGVDDSGSIHRELRGAVHDVCVMELERLQAGWVEVRSIGRSSYADGLIARLERSPVNCPNRFSADCRRAAVRESGSFARRLHAAVGRVREFPEKAADATDLSGFLAAAGEALAADPDASHRTVLATDLEGTVKRVFDLRLEGTIEVWMQLPDDPAVAERRRTTFTEQVLAAGARKVLFRPLTKSQP